MMENAIGIANAFADARRSGTSIDTFPGKQPSSLKDAYIVQDLEIGFLEKLPGWKVAGVRPDLRESLGAERLAGPITQLVEAGLPGIVDIQTIDGGFAAVEAEFAFRIARDLPLSGTTYTDGELIEAVAALHIASEIAGSPLASLSDLGPTAVVSDHGNNAAVIIGSEIIGWRERALDSLTAHTLVNGETVGRADASSLPTNGPLGSLAFLVRNLAERGKYLKAGDWVATGAITGVHRVKPGDHAVIDFGQDGRMEIRID